MEEYVSLLEKRLKWYYDYVDFVVKKGSVTTATSAMKHADKLEQERLKNQETKNG